jgi:hypothetical protein
MLEYVKHKFHRLSNPRYAPQRLQYFDPGGFGLDFRKSDGCKADYSAKGYRNQYEYGVCSGVQSGYP